MIVSQPIDLSFLLGVFYSINYRLFFNGFDKCYVERPILFVCFFLLVAVNEVTIFDKREWMFDRPTKTGLVTSSHRDPFLKHSGSPHICLTLYPPWIFWSRICAFRLMVRLKQPNHCCRGHGNTLTKLHFET